MSKQNRENIVVQQIIVESLLNHSYDNAFWLAQRNYQQNQSEENMMLYCELALIMNKPQEVICTLTPLKNPNFRESFLLAKAYFKTNKFEESEKVLQQEVIGKNNLGQMSRDVAHYYSLLGETKERLNKKEEAIFYYEEALKVNPYLFTTLENLMRITEVSPLNKTVLEEEVFIQN
jgi:tetratricopeptide (TPR) repeat protein